MLTKQAQELFSEIKAYYDSIEHPKYRHVDLVALNEKYQRCKDSKMIWGRTLNI